MLNICAKFEIRPLSKETFPRETLGKMSLHQLKGSQCLLL